jgi:DNA-binding transcriptional ArsR family regulator
MASRPLSADQLQVIADRFRALGEASRLHILSALREGELNVTQLIDATGFGQANLSKHLQLLLRLGFVERRKEGVSTFYRLADAEVLRLCEIMCGRLEKEVARQRKLFAR